jgi:predicted N-acetyltransferase YhbS
MRTATFDRDITRVIPAWLVGDRSSRTAATSPTGEPHLRLQVVQDDDDALVVEIAEGHLGTRGSLLYLQDRGSFQVTAVLRRQGIGGARVYLRLRASRPRSAARSSR